MTVAKCLNGLNVNQPKLSETLYDGGYGNAESIVGRRYYWTLMVDYGIEAHAKVEVDNADIERFLWMKIILIQML